MKTKHQDAIIMSDGTLFQTLEYPCLRKQQT